MVDKFLGVGARGEDGRAKSLQSDNAGILKTIESGNVFRNVIMDGTPLNISAGSSYNLDYDLSEKTSEWVLMLVTQTTTQAQNLRLDVHYANGDGGFIPANRLWWEGNVEIGITANYIRTEYLRPLGKTLRVVIKNIGNEPLQINKIAFTLYQPKGESV